MEYRYKTKPFKHQREYFDNNKDEINSALFWEQGTGKTKPIIDKTSYLFQQGKIECLIVVAPNGVHRNWLSDEIPAHMPDSVVKQSKMFMWNADKAENKSFAIECKRLLRHEGLIIFVINYNAVITKRGKLFINKLLRQKRCFMVLDESHYIKSPGAKRTISITAMGKWAKYRSILTGTPIANGPFDIYSQIKFLDDFFWHDKRVGTFAAFKQYFGIWVTAESVKKEWGYDPGYDQFVDFKNIDKLEKALLPISHRLTKEDAGLDLPPKLYSTRYFDMNPEQKRLYEELTEEWITELEDGEIVEATLAIVRLLRLQQIICGYVGTEPDEPLVKISGKNYRLLLLSELCEAMPHKCIIWARFIEDINQIMNMLSEAGLKAVRYDGQVDNETRAQNKEEFQNGEAQFFVANPMAGATGLTLHAARTVIYYSNTFNLVDRLQSEDRAHRIGQEHPVNYIDLICNGTVDEKIIKSLRSKLDIASEIIGDDLREWL